MKKSMGFYIHIPFCVRKCNYCDFLSAPADEETKRRYLYALCQEIRLLAERFSEQAAVCSVFIGGGTPSIWPGEYIIKVCETLYSCFEVLPEAEITIECNPGTIDKEKLLCYKKCGINRLSFGLQSTEDRLLKKLGRIHTYEEFKENYLLARAIGFKNINIDLMSALPDQTLSDYEETLRKVIELKPEHISAYSLIIEEGTPFYNAPLVLPDEDTEREMYHITKKLLAAAGYKRYEISNYAEQGFESRHNSLYWTGEDYLGAGLGASSYVGGKRWSNISSLTDYLRLSDNSDNGIKHCEILDSLVTNEHTQTLKDMMEEYCFLGLRMTRGISISGFKKRFNRDFFEIYGDVIKRYVNMGLIVLAGDQLYFSEAGIDVSNVILADFLLD